MELYERQAFDMFVSLAVERFCERIVQRNGGMERALARLREDPDGEGVWLGRFVEAFFRENALDNPGGACLVLRALERWEAPKTGAGSFATDGPSRFCPPGRAEGGGGSGTGACVRW